MAWEELTIEELAKRLNVNAVEVREKRKLILLIVKTRKLKKLSQQALAKKMDVTQGRIAQIESGLGTSRVTFDILLSILHALGMDYRIVPKKAA